MRLLLMIMFFSLIYIVTSKNNVKMLTESMGQEVIEIGTPIKELPMGLEEEPAADSEEDDKQRLTSNTVQPATKKDTKKITTLADDKKRLKDIEKIDGMSQDEEEARIEKELAEIYKDTSEYKTDSGDEKEVVKDPPKDIPSSDDAPSSSEELDKPIGRQRTNFKFQPESTNKADVELFRTSIDEISCNNRQKLSGTVSLLLHPKSSPDTPVTSRPGQATKPAPSKKEANKAFNNVSNGIALITVTLCYVFICT